MVVNHFQRLGSVFFTVENDVLHNVIPVLTLGEIYSHFEQFFQDERFADLPFAVFKVFLDDSTAIRMNSEGFELNRMRVTF